MFGTKRNIHRKGFMKKYWKVVLFWALVFIGALLILTQVGYSDGDDAFFYENTRNRSFFEYLNWRYQTWVGRMTAEAMVYITFRFGLTFWRIVDALMLILLPIGVIRLSLKAAGGPELQTEIHDEALSIFGLSVASVTGYFLMSAMTLGYAAVWVNGSIFYTWSFTFGVWSLLPIADAVFDTGQFSWKKLLYSIPFAVIATMSIEQMGAVLLAFQGIGLVSLIWKKRRIHPGVALQFFATLAAFLILFLAPGNELRVASEITNWMPQYDMLTFPQHFFIVIQWLLSSFANENRLFLAGIWLAGIWLLLQEKKRTRSDGVWILFGAIFLIVSFLPYAGITVLSDMGMNIADITVCVDQVPMVALLTTANKIALIWWTLALVFTFAYLWRISKFHVTLLLAYLAGIASEAILFFSPTMYASGARVYYLTDLLYLFVILVLSLSIHRKEQRRYYYLLLILFGAINLMAQIPVLAEQLW